jgi:hypothetical protein
MGDRGSKSDIILLNVSVKEQRVDGSSGYKLIDDICYIYLSLIYYL